MIVSTAYIITDGDKLFLCVLLESGEFFRFQIKTVTAARLGSEGSTVSHKAIAKGE